MKAVFLDRDGVINPLVYYHEIGIIDSPFTVKQFRLMPGAAQAIVELGQAGFKVVLVSNQPAIAKGHLSRQTFQRICHKMRHSLAREGARLDGEYYCFHHPQARAPGYRQDCGCRKPKPGLLLQAGRELGLNLAQSWMVGDSLTDVLAGQGAGCASLLLGTMKCELCRQMEEMGARPQAVVANLQEATRTILEREGCFENLR